MPDTPILTDPADVHLLAEELKRFKTIAVDLEADSMHSYRDKVCLLQFTTPERTVLLDPLAAPDLAPLRPVFADEAIRKVFHAADYDIRCLYRDFSIEVNGLFDTMVASQFLGEERVGLADVLLKYFEVTLDKKYQRADWSARPLTDGMIRYAAEDTRYLLPLAEILESQLEKKGRLSWVAEEFSLLEGVRHSEAEGPMFLRTKGAGTLRPRQLAVLEGLLQWRDSEAQRRDCPPFKVLGNKSLLSLAQRAPRSLGGVANAEGMVPRLVRRYGNDLLQQIAAAMALPEDALPEYPRSPRPARDAKAERRLADLKQWRKETAGTLEMDPGVVINNALLEDLSRRCPRTAAELEDVSNLKNWQRQALGEGILSTLTP